MVHLLLFDGQVTLVSRERHYESILVCRRVRLHFIDPVLRRFERRLVAQIVANNRADRITIVHVDH